jgi:hypothetical protein
MIMSDPSIPYGTEINYYSQKGFRSFILIQDNSALSVRTENLFITVMEIISALLSVHTDSCLALP